MSNLTFKHQTNTTHFSIFYNSFKDKSLLKKIKELIEEVYKNNRELFDVDEDFKANIYFYDDIKKFKKENLKKSDNYSVAKEYKREIRAIHPEKLMTDSSYASGGYCYERIREVLSATLIIVFFKEGKTRREKWVIEGVSGMISNTYSYSFNHYIAKPITKEKFDLILSGKTKSRNLKIPDWEFGGLVVAFSKYIVFKYSLKTLKKIIFSKEDIFKILGKKRNVVLKEFNNYIESDNFLVPKILNHKKKFSKFTFYYTNSLNDKTLKILKDTLQENYKRITLFFNVKKNFQTKVFIFPTIETFHMELDSRQGPNWYVGCSTGKSINMVDPRRGAPTHNFKSMLSCIVHEFTHYVTFLDGKKRNVYWLTEGIANYLANPTPRKYILRYLENKGLDENIIFGDNYKVFQNNGGYYFPQTIIEYIIKTYSEKTLKKILTTPQKTPYEIMKVKKEDFIESWKEYFLKKYKKN